MKKTILLPILVATLIILFGCSTSPKENSDNTSKTKTSDKNSWYMPKPGTTWQWQLSGSINTDYKVDLYDVDLVDTPQAVIDELHSRDIKVICYFSAGTREDYREDAQDFPTEIIGNSLEDWPDEKWLNISQYDSFADIMKKRLDLAVQKKCDGVEPDNIDGYQADTGFNLSYSDQLAYNKWLAEEAHKRNLSVAQKNDLDQVNDLVNDFDFAINEQCFAHDECNLLLPYIQQDKAILGVEYELETSDFCEEANKMGFSWLQTNYDLDGDSLSCK
ncbi:endo alpha-1,4 polygalactosaminidase [Patescibacteria group bacterium]|nr:endo alpha-1,4 polygalactosaminidase [Patescibacteria group bacterium]